MYTDGMFSPAIPPRHGRVCVAFWVHYLAGKCLSIPVAEVALLVNTNDES